jgi:hypothetical protein
MLMAKYHEKRSSAMAAFGENINVGGVKAIMSELKSRHRKKWQIMSA